MAREEASNTLSHSLPSIARPLVACQSKKGRGEPRSGEEEGLWVRGFWRVALVYFFLSSYYILSGTSMPSSAMPFLMVFATFLASTRRTAFSSALSAPRIE